MRFRSYLRRSWWAVALILMEVTLSGCQVQSVPTPTPTTPPVDRRATLNAIGTINAFVPPTWTPAPTRTPLPSNTPVPSRTPIPTLSAEGVCAQFIIAAAPADGIRLAADSAAQFAWSGVPAGSGVGVQIRLLNSNDAGILLTMPFDGDGIFRFSLGRLPGYGTYGWKLWIQHTLYGDICATQGTFTRLPPGTAQPILTFTPAPAPVTPTPTPDVF